MRFKKLILKDFFRYYGNQEIDCSVDKNKSVVVLIGENGRGKTTILSAFNWVLYDTLLEPLIEENMLNYRKREEMKENTTTESYVELLFEENGVDYILKRSLEFKKDNYSRVTNLTSKGKTTIFKVESNGNRVEVNVQVFKERFLIPKDLSGFFFFDGERINRLAKVDGKKEIKKAILNILGISHIERAKTDISKIKRKLLDESKKYSNGNDYNKLVDDISQLEEGITNIEIEMNKNDEKISLAEKKLDDVNEIIRNSDNKNVKELEKERDRVDTILKNEGRRLDEIEKRIKKHIGENFKFYLAKGFIEDTEKILEEKKKDGILPSNIKETFINDLIKNKKCICGTCLEIGSKEYEAVIGMKEQAGSKELDDAYYKLKSLIAKIKKNSTSFYSILDELTKERENIKSTIYDMNNQLDIISNKLKNIDIETIRNAENLRESFRNEINKLNQKKGKYEIRLGDYTKRKQSLEKDLRNLNSNNKQIMELQSKLDIIDQLETLNTEFKDMFTQVVREELDLRIKEVFSKITNKEYRIPVLTKDFELKITSKLNQVDLDESEKRDEILSTGEGQITSLSFIGALVSYARDKKDDYIMSKLSGEEYPIVMDSPFGNLDEVHTKNVAANIGKLSSQVIIVVSQKQWEGHVENNILQQVKRKYRMIDGDVGVYQGECTFIREEVN
ncbi:MAG: hypothetical protein ACLTAJ_08735 [Clostridium sp.]|uniref:hypothetical protein n=1 Tax=Clostridium sp. TaxID=1506 RepID=UPI003992DA9D